MALERILGEGALWVRALSAAGLSCEQPPPALLAAEEGLRSLSSDLSGQDTASSAIIPSVSLHSHPDIASLWLFFFFLPEITLAIIRRFIELKIPPLFYLELHYEVEVFILNYRGSLRMGKIEIPFSSLYCHYHLHFGLN